MRLNHLDLAVPDVAAATAFFTSHFGFSHLETRGNQGLAILRGADGFVLVLTRLKEAATASYPKTFHIGFLLDSAARVHEVHARLKAAGVDSLSEVAEMRGSTLLYCRGPGDTLIEVGYRP